MSLSKVLTIGAPVTCSDGECGELHQVVVDPLAGTVTHLVVEPPHQQGAGRLVPVGLISRAVPELRLDCTLAEFDVLELAEDTQFLPGAPASWALGSEQVLSWPYYGSRWADRRSSEDRWPPTEGSVWKVPVQARSC